MHELDIVQDVIANILPKLEAFAVTHVTQIKVRRDSAFSEYVLRQAYEAATSGTLLEGTQLFIETVNLDYLCRCGHKQVITADDLIGQMFLCRGCGSFHEINETQSLELLEVIAEIA